MPRPPVDADSPHHVVVVAFEAVQALDVVGPTEVFDVARQIGTALGHAGGYRSTVAAPSARSVRATSGLTLATVPLAEVTTPIDTLVVAGGTGMAGLLADSDALDALRAAADGAARICSVCTGAMALAELGLLDGRRATTHWAWCDELAERHPGVTVEPEPIFVRDGPVWTSAGVTAGMDLALALVAEDHGDELAHEVARWLVLYTRRPGGQAQFSVQLAGRAPTTPGLADLQTWILEHLDEDLPVARLAAEANMAPRTFARTFAREVGMTPAAYVEAARVEAAMHHLQLGSDKVAAVARRCGFGTTETMYRAFRRRAGTTPGSYRDHFRTSTPTRRPTPAGRRTPA